jgi:adenosine deaminase CECR1
MKIALFLSVTLFAQDFGARFEEIRKAASPREMYSFFYDMPKGGDIHHHLSLSFRAADWLQAIAASPKGYAARVKLSNCEGEEAPQLRWRVASKAAMAPMSACMQGDFQPLADFNGEQKAAFISALVLDKPWEGRNEFFEAVVARLAEPARDPDLLVELTARTLKRYARENILYVESQFNPATEEAARQMRTRLAQADLKELPISMRFQGIVVRFRPDAEQLIERTYEFLDRNRDLWVGVNMAGREDNSKGYPLRFLETFRKLRRQYSGIHMSIHGGEMDAPGQEVRNTLLIGAERIGHGVNLISDPDTMLLMRSGRNLVEVSLVSNQLLEYTPDLAKHPFIEYLRFGIPVCLNTDDAGVWDSNLTDEYWNASKYFSLTWAEIVRIGRASLEHSFAQPDLKQKLLERFDLNVKAFEQKYSTGDWKALTAKVPVEESGYARRAILR